MKELTYWKYFVENCYFLLKYWKLLHKYCNVSTESPLGYLSIETSYLSIESTFPTPKYILIVTNTFMLKVPTQVLLLDILCPTLCTPIYEKFLAF